MMNRQRIDSTRQYEQALAEFIEIQSAEAPSSQERLDQLTAQIDDYEQRMWTEDLFENFDTVRLMS